MGGRAWQGYPVFFESHSAVINQGCFGVLRVRGPRDMAFEIVEDDWLRRLRYSDCASIM